MVGQQPLKLLAKVRTLLPEIRPRGAVWSARHPVTVEVVGSNPTGDAGRSILSDRARFGGT